MVPRNSVSGSVKGRRGLFMIKSSVRDQGLFKPHRGRGSVTTGTEAKLPRLAAYATFICRVHHPFHLPIERAARVAGGLIGPRMAAGFCSAQMRGTRRREHTNYPRKQKIYCTHAMKLNTQKVWQWEQTLTFLGSQLVFTYEHERGGLIIKLLGKGKLGNNSVYYCEKMQSTTALVMRKKIPAFERGSQSVRRSRGTVYRSIYGHRASRSIIIKTSTPRPQEM
ncbi:hypothetical protein BU15DRAFT_62042 [Melanogaster broomeanus]|nr:hypothetical protein BU15DRAFT_62042 [Melanogaster broomeanus]